MAEVTQRKVYEFIAYTLATKEDPEQKIVDDGVLFAKDNEEAKILAYRSDKVVKFKVEDVQVVVRPF